MHFCYEISFIFLVSLVEISHATPPSYCLESFNRSDCKLPPQKVFSYYKPGSRCEVDTWRGCPTLNMFETEEECSNICIFTDSNADIIPIEGAVNEICLYNPVHVERCDQNLSKVYVYNSILKSCIPIMWGGCPRPRNVFEDELTCVKVCSQIHWSGSGMSKAKINQFNSIVNNLLNNITEYVEKFNVNAKNDSNYTTTKTTRDGKLSTITKNTTTTTTKNDRILLKGSEENVFTTDKDEDESSEGGVPLKATDSSFNVKSTTVTTSVASTTIKKTEKTTELETSTTAAPVSTTQISAQATIKRGTAKEVVLPQDFF